MVSLVMTLAALCMLYTANRRIQRGTMRFISSSFSSLKLIILLPSLLALFHCAPVPVLAFSFTRHVSGQGTFPPKLPTRAVLLRPMRESSTRRNVFDTLSPDIMEQITTQDLLDRILDESLRTSARRPIMIQFDPSSRAIWRHWKGTVFAETWRAAVRKAIWAVVVYFLFRNYPGIQKAFSGFNVIWAQVLGVTTFTLTFFVNQSYAIWCRILQMCRDLQGRLNDFLMTGAAYAQRTDEDTSPYSILADGPSTFTEKSRKLLLVEGRYVRLFSILLFASLTRSHRPLLTPQGLRSMVARGLMTEEERAVLKMASVPANARHNVVLMWMFRAMLQGFKTKCINGGAGFEQQMIGKIQEIRGLANGMESVLKGRMPFSYAHIVQVLVDATLWFYPFMIFSTGINLFLGVAGTLVLTTCYQGLFDLAKQFLDPFHNEKMSPQEVFRDSLIVDTLIAETNANSVRYLNCLDIMPITTQDIATGNLDKYILPDDGFTVEQAAQNEALKRAQEMDRTKEEVTKQERTSLEETILSLEETENELKETVAILNAQPGLDFVPGLDDQGESLAYHKSYGRNSTDTTSLVEVDVVSDDSNQLADQFNEVADVQLKEVKELVDGDVNPPFS